MPCLYFQNLDFSQTTPESIKTLRYQLALDAGVSIEEVNFYYEPHHLKIITDEALLVSSPVKVTIEWFGSSDRDDIKKFIAAHIQEFLAKLGQDEKWNLVFLDMPARAFYFEGTLVAGGVLPSDWLWGEYYRHI